LVGTPGQVWRACGRQAARWRRLGEDVATLDAADLCVAKKRIEKIEIKMIL
jgi:hypothetical protein